VLGRFGVGRSLLLSLLRRGARIRPPAACTFADGMEALPRAMAADLGDRLSLDARVRSLGRRGAAWVLETDAGPLEAREVVLAVPAPAAARLLEPVAADAARSAAALRYNPLVVVHVEAETGLRGLGFQVSLAEDLPLRGVTFNDSLFGRSRLYTAYLGGARHAALADEADDVLGGLALETFRHTTGADGRTISVARESMPAWDRSWSALEGLALPGGIHLAGNWTERPGVPGRLAQASALARTLAAGRVGSAGAVPAS
jgi:oxygen-dependent protoporphyrinogen oxidase